jgi:hypothetical protein
MSTSAFATSTDVEYDETAVVMTDLEDEIVEENDETEDVSVAEKDNEIWGQEEAISNMEMSDDINDEMIDDGIETLSTREVIDLSSKSQIINKKIPADTTIRSTYNYKTNSEKIKLTVKGSDKTSVKIELYVVGLLGTSTRHAYKTVELSTEKSKTVTFSDLDSNKTYYFKYTNNDSHSVTMTGTATD